MLLSFLPNFNIGYQISNTLQKKRRRGQNTNLGTKGIAKHRRTMKQQGAKRYMGKGVPKYNEVAKHEQAAKHQGIMKQRGTIKH
jgi:hypothetical protein